MAGRETHTGDEFTHPAALTLILDPMAARRRRRRAMVIGALGLELMGAYGAVGLTVKIAESCTHGSCKEFPSSQPRNFRDFR